MTGKLTTFPRGISPPEKKFKKNWNFEKNGRIVRIQRYSVQELLLRQNTKTTTRKGRSTDFRLNTFFSAEQSALFFGLNQGLPLPSQSGISGVQMN